MPNIYGYGIVRTENFCVVTLSPVSFIEKLKAAIKRAIELGLFAIIGTAAILYNPTITLTAFAVSFAVTLAAVLSRK